MPVIKEHLGTMTLGTIENTNAVAKRFRDVYVRWKKEVVSSNISAEQNARIRDMEVNSKKLTFGDEVAYAAYLLMSSLFDHNAGFFRKKSNNSIFGVSKEVEESLAQGALNLYLDYGQEITAKDLIEHAEAVFESFKAKNKGYISENTIRDFETHPNFEENYRIFKDTIASEKPESETVEP